jgi:hypothetical protein
MSFERKSRRCHLPSQRNQGAGALEYQTERLLPHHHCAQDRLTMGVSPTGNGLRRWYHLLAQTARLTRSNGMGTPAPAALGPVGRWRQDRVVACCIRTTSTDVLKDALSHILLHSGDLCFIRQLWRAEWTSSDRCQEKDAKECVFVFIR